MKGKSHRHISDHLSELVEDVTQTLHDAHAILVDDDGFSLTAENLGIIASYHHVSFRTLDTCNQVRALQDSWYSVFIIQLLVNSGYFANSLRDSR